MQNIRPLRAAAMVLAMTIVAAPAIALAQAGPTTRHVKNVVLVHGAWADGSGWEGVYNILANDGYNVTIVTHSNQSLDSDVADTKRVLDRQDGPTILAGHSYGGTIITEAGANAKVVGLVYIAAFVPDIGESTLGEYPKGSPPPPVDISQDGMSFFRHDAYLAAFAPQVQKPKAEFMAASQVPFAIEKAGLAPVTVAAWKSKRHGISCRKTTNCFQRRWPG
jgi:pimeloyl-ACP methyl ester carboxylesterase